MVYVFLTVIRVLKNLRITGAPRSRNARRIICSLLKGLSFGFGKNTNNATIAVATAEFHLAIYESIESVVFTQTYVLTGMVNCTSLTNQNVAGFGDLTTVTFTGMDEARVLHGAVKFKNSLSALLNLPEYQADVCDILQCAGLLHDIGNPPFGHFGEVVIRDWFKEHMTRLSFKERPLSEILTPQMQQDLYHFEGNTQALRVVSKLHYLVDENGMNLTKALLATIIKYPTSSLEINKKSGNIKHKKIIIKTAVVTYSGFVIEQ